MKKMFVFAMVFAIFATFAFGQKTYSGSFSISKDGQTIGTGNTRVVSSSGNQTTIIFKCSQGDWIGLALSGNSGSSGQGYLAFINSSTGKTRNSYEIVWNLNSRGNMTVSDQMNNRMYFFRY